VGVGACVCRRCVVCQRFYSVFIISRVRLRRLRQRRLPLGSRVRRMRLPHVLHHHHSPQCRAHTAIIRCLKAILNLLLRYITYKQMASSAEADAEFASMMRGFDLSNKKRKPKKTVGDDEGDGEADYTYEQLLSRIMKKIHKNHPDLVEKRQYVMKPPHLMRIGTNKTMWVNFQDICQMMHRDAEHVFRFFMSELGADGSIDGNHRLIIRGKYKPAYIESLLRKYIAEYVACQTCRSPNTALARDSTSRLHFVQCRDCSASRSVVQIRTGFHAQTRADRRAARNG